MVTAAVVCAPRFLSPTTQEPKKPGVLPGLYQEGPCALAQFPSVLPAVNDALDSAALAQALGDSSLDKTLILSLRLGALDSDPRVRVFRKQGSADVAQRVLAAVLATLRPIQADMPWAFRLQLDPGVTPTMSVARSELCPPAFKSGVTLTKSFRMEEGQAVELQRGAEENARLLQMVVLRVLVQPDGKASEVVTVALSGDRQIDSQMQQAVQRGRFFPAKLDGASVAAWLQVGKPR
jgi:hypothetical protein